MREQFLVEITGEPDVVGRHHVTDLAELNRLFQAWVETAVSPHGAFRDRAYPAGAVGGWLGPARWRPGDARLLPT